MRVAMIPATGLRIESIHTDVKFDLHNERAA